MKLSEEHKRKISQTLMGHSATKGFTGRHHSAESKAKTRLAMLGKQNSLGFARPWTDEQRKHMSKVAIARKFGVGNKWCVGRKYSPEVRLFVHHIDYDKKNCNPDNLITLCNSCHSQTNWGRDEWQKYFLEKKYLTSPKIHG